MQVIDSLNQEQFETFLRYPGNGSYSNLKSSVEKEEVVFQNMSFYDCTTLYSGNKHKTVLFENCAFHNLKVEGMLAERRNYNFINCELNCIEIHGSNSHFVKIQNCRISEIITYGGLANVLINNFDICCKIVSLNIKRSPAGSQVDKIHVDIQEANIDNVIVNSIPTELNVEGCLINILRFDAGIESLSKLTIGASTFIHEVYVTKCSQEVIIDNATIDKIRFQLKESTSDKLTISITGCDINSFEFGFYSKLHSLNIGEDSNIRYLSLLHGSISGIYISSCVIDELSVSLGYFKFDEFNLNGQRFKMHVNRLLLDGLISEGVEKKVSNLVCSKITVTELRFDSVVNQGNVFFSEVTSDNRHTLNDLDKLVNFENSDGEKLPIEQDKAALFHIRNSDLGKLNFVACDFSKMKMELAGSKINEIYLSGTEMPLNLTGNFKDRQLGYAQLKKVYDNRGDSVKTQEYLSKELDAHYNCVKAQKEDLNKQELWTLRLNKISNNFGTDWLLALKGILVVSVPIYILYIWSLNHLPEIVEQDGNQLSSFFDTVALFFEFLSPIHKSEFIAEKLGRSSTAISWSLEFLGRIVNGYLIYQFVQAFRKYGKK